MNKKQILIIDTDPGVDDALALTMLKNLNQELETYEKIIYSSIGGNTSLENTHQNMLNILDNLSLKYDNLLIGSESTLVGEKFVDAEHYHGKNGLTLELQKKSKPDDLLEAYEYIQQLYIDKKNVEITLLMLGPLTNLAKALVSTPKISTLIKSVVIMGGAFYISGNATKYAEFNIYADPEAANIVFKSGLAIKAIGLDVCQDVVINRNKFYDSQYLFTKSKNNASRFARSLIDSFFKFHPDRNEMSLCDPIAVICLFHDNEFVYNTKEVTVETKNPKRGLTIPSNKNGKVAIAIDLNSIKVMNLIDKSLT
tara:strand:+ start:12465 stop:13397 length:933 start_codon:yes stop_codon:yes gene_type:complete